MKVGLLNVTSEIGKWNTRDMAEKAPGQDGTSGTSSRLRHRRTKAVRTHARSLTCPLRR